jgi:hypothetical protein
VPDHSSGAVLSGIDVHGALGCRRPTGERSGVRRRQILIGRCALGPIGCVDTGRARRRTGRVPRPHPASAGRKGFVHRVRYSSPLICPAVLDLMWMAVGAAWPPSCNRQRVVRLTRHLGYLARTPGSDGEAKDAEATPLPGRP